MNPLTEDNLRAHPELASLVALAAQLELLPKVLATVHGPDDRGALVDQARSIARVCSVLSDQTRAYVGLIEVDAHGKRPKLFR